MTADASPDNTEPPAPIWMHCGAGLHIGRMEHKPFADEFGAVLSVGASAANIDPALRHRHIPISYVNTDPESVAEAVLWVWDQFAADRTVLVRSEGGLQRPGLVVAATLVRMGAASWEALTCVRRHDHRACSDFRYQHMIRAIERTLRP